MRCSPANFKISLPRLAPNKPFQKFGRRGARAGSPPAYSPSGQLRIGSARFAIFTWAASGRQRSFWKYDSAGGADRWGGKQREKNTKLRNNIQQESEVSIQDGWTQRHLANQAIPPLE